MATIARVTAPTAAGVPAAPTRDMPVGLAGVRERLPALPLELGHAGGPAARDAGRRAATLVGTLALAALPVLMLVVACAAVATPSLVVVGHARLPAWIVGVLPGAARIDRAGLAGLEAAMLVAWLVALAAGHRLPWRVVLGVIVLVDVLALLAPPLLSTDVFNYIDGGRLFALHGINPYVHGPAAAPFDPVFAWTGPRWIHTPTVYGPLFTLLAGALAPLGTAGALWAFKLLAALALVGITLCVASTVRARGGNPTRAALLVGANPVLLIWGVAGAHNDMLMALGLAVAVLLHTRGHSERGVLVGVAAAAVKLSAGVVAPFLVLGAQRRARTALIALTTAGALLLVSLQLWGTAPLGVGGVLARHQWIGERGSVPGWTAIRLGLAPPGPEARFILQIVAGAIVTACLAWTLARRRSWLGAATVAAFAVLCLSTSFYPWYLALVLPLAAVAPGVLAPAAGIAISCLVILMRTGHWLFGFSLVLHHVVVR